MKFILKITHTLTFAFTLANSTDPLVVGQLAHGQSDTKELFPLERVQLQGQTGFVSAIGYRPDGKSLVTGSQYVRHRLQVWDSATGRLIHALPTELGIVRSVAMSGNGQRLASIGPSGEAERVDTARFSPDFGEIGISKQFQPVENILEIWDVDQPDKQIRISDRSSDYWFVSLDREGRHGMGLDTRGALKVWDLDGSRLVGVLGDQNRAESSLGFSPAKRADGSADGRRAVSVGIVRHDQAAHSRVTCWQIESGQSWSLDPHEGTVGCVAISPDGAFVAIASHPSTLTLWDPADGRMLLRCQDEALNGAYFLAFSPDSDLFVTAGEDGILWGWDRATGRKLWKISGLGTPIRAISFKNDTLKIAEGGYQSSKEIDPKTNMVKFDPITLWDVSITESK